MVMWYWSADDLISQVSIDHNLMSYIKKVHSKPGAACLSTYYLEYGCHVARLHRRHRRRRRAYTLTGNTPGHNNVKKSIHRFPLFPYMGLGLCLAALRAVGASLKILSKWMESWPLIMWLISGSWTLSIAPPCEKDSIPLQVTASILIRFPWEFTGTHPCQIYAAVWNGTL